MRNALQNQISENQLEAYDVLVVDDCALSLETLTLIVSDEGHIVFPAACGEEAISKADVLKPDIILLDLNMPGIGGIRTLQALKTRAVTADIPVIIVSSGKEDIDIARALDLGAHDYVVKPVNNLVLAARIRSALRCSHQRWRPLETATERA